MKRQAVVFCSISLGLAGSWAFSQVFKSPAITSSAESKEPQRDQKKEGDERRKMAWKIVAPSLEIAHKETLAALTLRTRQVSDFFDERQKNLHTYAKRAFSYKSKFAADFGMWSALGKDRHAKFLKDKFAKIVFSEVDLAKQITRASEDYVRDVNAIENALLTKVRADIQDFPECAAILSAINTDELFRERFAAMTKQLSQSVQTDVQVDVGMWVGGEIVEFVAIQVGKAIAARLGVSAGIVGTGTVMAPETLGVSLIAAVVVDQLIGWVVGYFHDPVAEIESKLQKQLKKLSTLIVNGDAKTRGLVQEFTTLAEQRKVIREGALQQMILNAQPEP